MIDGKTYWLWRAIDAAGDILDILVQPRRNAKAAKRFLRRLTAQFGDPRVVVTDKLRGYIKPIHDRAPSANHRAHKGLNDRAGILTVQRDGARKSWGVSSHPGRPRGFSPLMARSTPSSSPVVTNSLQFPAATPVPTHVGCGMTTPSK